MRHNVRAHQGPWKSKELEEMDIHLKDHRVPSSAVDWFALRIVKMLRHLPDMFFRDKYVHRAVMLETVAAVPGMVGGMLRHLRSLRRMQHDGGWVGHLLHEAENERMHLMTWMRLMKPTFFERSLVIAVQGIFFNAFFVLYVLSPRLAHRIVGYLEEEAVISYTHMLREIDAGRIDNGPAPEIAIAYYNLAPDAAIRDVVLAVRADEALHRDVNHHFSDRILLRRENLREELTHEKAQSLSGKQYQLK
ncbi:alternative oxidase [Ramicandelaber brevisporus]|nr:alternative oxidase [Ramicandelaber brevisporus]